MSSSPSLSLKYLLLLLVKLQKQKQKQKMSVKRVSYKSDNGTLSGQKTNSASLRDAALAYH